MSDLKLSWKTVIRIIRMVLIFPGGNFSWKMPPPFDKIPNPVNQYCAQIVGAMQTPSLNYVVRKQMKDSKLVYV